MTDNTAPTEAGPAGLGALERAPRRLRADAQRNIGSLLAAAKAVFGTSGVDAPAKEIADQAGVGVGTLYRHFPQRSDLVKAVFQREVDACADAAAACTVRWTAVCRGRGRAPRGLPGERAPRRSRPRAVRRRVQGTLRRHLWW